MAEQDHPSDVGNSEESGVTVGLLDANSSAEPIVSIIIAAIEDIGDVDSTFSVISEFLTEFEISGEIILVDVADEAAAIRARELGGRVVPPNGGSYGAAIRNGARHARGDYVAFGDAGGAYDFSELPDLFSRLEHGADLVLGRRARSDDTPMPWRSRLFSLLPLRAFLLLFAGYDISDSTTGLRAVRRQALDALEWSNRDWMVGPEMVMSASAAEFKIAEVPVTYDHSNSPSRADVGGWDTIGFMFDGLPADIYTVGGLLMGVLGIGMLAGTFFELSLPVGAGGVKLGERSTLAGSLLAILGLQFTAFGANGVLEAWPRRPGGAAVTAGILYLLTFGRAILAGVIVLASGLVYAANLLSIWIASGYDALPTLSEDIIAFTAIVLGIQVMGWAVVLRSKSPD